jgi:hypothetical protein
MMPRGAPIATLGLLACAACSPQEFVWDDVGPDQLQHYRTSFQTAAGNRLLASSTRNELLHRLRDERILWLGDHHRSPRLHALQQQLLVQLQADGVQLAFALEAIGSQDEPDVQRFLRGDASMPWLRAEMQTRWHGSWLDDEEVDVGHYRALLTFARDHQIPVAALEATPRRPIEPRAGAFVACVRPRAERWPARLLVVHVGQLHLVGVGDVVARTGRGGFVFGAEPPPALRASSALPLTPAPPPGSVWRSDGGLWWFGELLGR